MNELELLENDVPKHKKKSKREKPKKAKHKHDYVHVLLRFQRKNEDRYIHMHGRECTICQKTGCLPWKESLGLEGTYISIHTDIEEKYPNLRIVDVDPLF